MISVAHATLVVSRSILLCSVLLFAHSAPEAHQQTNAEEEGKVKQVIIDFAAAWDRHDVNEMVALHSDDVNFTNIFGIVNKGPEQVRAILQMGHGAGGIFTKAR